MHLLLLHLLSPVNLTCYLLALIRFFCTRWFLFLHFGFLDSFLTFSFRPFYFFFLPFCSMSLATLFFTFYFLQYTSNVQSSQLERRDSQGRGGVIKPKYMNGVISSNHSEMQKYDVEVAATICGHCRMKTWLDCCPLVGVECLDVSFIGSGSKSQQSYFIMSKLNCEFFYNLCLTFLMVKVKSVSSSSNCVHMGK